MKILLILLMMLPVTVLYGHELEMINLKHRSADELLPLIRPLLDKDEMVSGMNYQLILRVSQPHFAQIRRILDDIDTAPRRLNITVMQDVDSDTVARLTELSGSVGAGNNARIIYPGGAGLAQDRLNARIISTRQLEDDKKTQQLQVIEGNRALVHTGQMVSLPQRQVMQTAWGAQVIETMQYRDVGSGFYVLPRIHGDIATLEITTQNEVLSSDQNSASMPAMRTQNSTTVISGHLGEWMVVGGLVRHGSSDGSTITTRSRSSMNEQHTVLIRVDEVN